MKQKIPTKSPLQEAPLRNPAESTERHIDKLVNEDAISYVMAGMMAIFLAGQEWVRHLMELPPSPYLTSGVAAIVVPICAWRFMRIRRKLANLRLGRDGEKAVGQGLESLREQGAKVFHDIPGANFNLDHVVIAPTGIFVVETKTYSKPAKGQGKLYFDGTHITGVNGYCSDKAVIQVQAAAHWLGVLIRNTTGKQFHVKPVIVFPGWYIETKPEAKNADIWVLNHKSLPTYIANNRESISPEEAALIAHSLSVYIRNQPAK